ncbi:MAG: trypsin-like peptidase domain-containing protein [Acidobacteria bacterium]|nr:trypsin-like peptidase domain-containing protein [Acidobacteriota bacterium]
MMFLRRLAIVSALMTLVVTLSFALGGYAAQRMAARTLADSEAQIAALRVEMSRTLGALRYAGVPSATGTAGRGEATALAADGGSRAAIVQEIKRELQNEMGLLPVQLLRDRRQSFVELYTYDNRGASNYGTAGYLGHGYFMTVKHGVIALGRQDDGHEPRRITSIKLMYRGHALAATIVDSGDAESEVDAGDWAILKVRERIDLPALRVNLRYGFNFADPLFRLGNDYSKGVIVATGYVGQRTGNGLVTCLTDGHPGVSGGGVLDQDGNLVGIPIGRMQGDYRFSFILPLRREMFRRVPAYQQVDSSTAE